MIRKNLMIVLLASLCLITGLFIIKPTPSKPGAGGYNPWADINGDGIIDIYDAIALAGAFGTRGAPLPKAGVVYDSGWINITDKRGQDFVITHNLNRTDLTLDITTRTTSDGPEQKCYGLKTIGGWQHTYGDFVDQEIHSIITTKDGGYAMGGDTQYNWYDFYFVKTDSNGSLQWSKTYGGSGMDRIYADVVQTSDGGYALAGCTSSYGGGDLDFWLVKTDENGTMLWSQAYGGPQEEIAFALIQTSDGGYVIGGRSLSFGPGYDFYVVKTNSTGDVEWAHNFGGPNDDYLWTPSTIVETDDGGLMFAGSTKSLGAGNGDIWMIKTDMLGNAVWNRTYGGANEEVGGALIKTTGGGYLISGSTASLGAGSQDAWLVKIDADGNEQWNRTYGGTSYDIVMSVVQTTDGGYAVGVLTKSFGLGGWDAWLIKTDDNGTKQWDRVFGGAGDDELYSIIQVSGDIFVLGGDTTSIGAGGLDGWLLQTDLEYGLVWKDTTPNSFTLFRPVNENQTNFVRVRLLQIEP